MLLTAVGTSVIAFVFIVLIAWFFAIKQRQNGEKRILILVLGDVGRSPRMQYHALSFAKEGWLVDIAGFGHSPLIEELQSHSLVKLLTLYETPNKPKFLPQIFYYIAKTVYLLVQLVLFVLCKTPRQSYILVQNPPAIPTLAAAWFISLLRNSTFIIDWHNYGFTILSLAVGSTHPLVKFSKFYEGAFGRRASHNICVTKAMKADLKTRWGISASTLYDRPPERFKYVDIYSRHEIFQKLSESYDAFKADSKSITETKFSTSFNKSVSLKNDRPALLISSTSWTEDEDFSLLLKALQIFDKAADNPVLKLPKVVCIITGKGPLKSHYQNVMSKTVLKHVQICTPWLETEDYPKIIGSADLGICLHTSSSGLDLPMKVVDMFGCGVPVCAVQFSCLDELVVHGKNGMVFNNAKQLAEQLEELLYGFPGTQEQLKKFQGNLKDFQDKRWHKCWKKTFYSNMFK